MKLGQPIELHLASRYYQFNRAFAIRDVFDALVELITNCDDSYHRLFKKGLRAEDGGPILVELCEQRKGQPSYLIVHDRAEGMTLQEMKEKLGDVGTRRSEEGDRGFMARGAKDCTELGKMIIESVKDERYYKCELTTKPQFIPWEDGRKVTKEIRDQLHVPHGNGTTVTLEIDHKMARCESIARDLPWHFALRDILAEESKTTALLKNLNRPNDRPEKLVHRQPDGELVCHETFDIPGYAGTSADLKIWKSPEPFDDPGDRTRRSGILVKGSRAIHECSLLYPEFEKDPHGKKYFGRLDVPYIDKILREYDERREKEHPHPEENPKLLIDPNRQHGLIRDHPFTQALYLIPSERLRALIAKDHEAERSKEQQVSNQETRSRLDRLAKKASEFLKQQLEDIQELAEGEDVDRDAFTKQGAFIFPTYLNVALGEERTLTYYVKASLVGDPEQLVSVEVSDRALTVVDAPFKLKPHRTKEDRLVGTFRVHGEMLKDAVIIKASCGSLAKEAIASVVDKRTEEHLFDAPLEFEHDRYTIREGSRKSLTLFAKCPEVVAEPTRVTLVSSDSAGIPVRGTCEVVPIGGSNYARGEVIVQGRKLNAKAEIKASVNGREATAQAKVVQKLPEAGIPLSFELSPDDFGNFRARWAEAEGKPHLLLISARHKSLARYLGPPPDYEGQNAPHFRVLLAEIVAEAVCGKSLELECKERAWDFRFADLKDDHVIANEVRARMQQRLRNFVAEAHAIMLSDAELKRMDGSRQD